MFFETCEWVVLHGSGKNTMKFRQHTCCEKKNYNKSAIVTVTCAIVISELWMIIDWYHLSAHPCTHKTNKQSWQISKMILDLSRTSTNTNKNSGKSSTNVQQYWWVSERPPSLIPGEEWKLLHVQQSLHSEPERIDLAALVVMHSSFLLILLKWHFSGASYGTRY